MSAEQIDQDELKRIWDSVRDDEEVVVPDEQIDVEEPVDALEDNEPEAVDELTEIRTRLDQLSGLDKRIRNTEGHLGGVISKLDGLQSQIQEGFQAVEDVSSPSEEEILAASESAEYWDSLEDKYPEWAKAFEHRIDMIPAGLSMDEVDKAISEHVTKLSEEFEVRLIEAVHHGWKDTVKTQDFTDWFSEADPDTQALADSPAAEDAIRLLDSFKSRTVKTPDENTEIIETRNKRLREAAALPKGGTPGSPTGKSVEDMDRKELWDYELSRRRGS